MRARKSFPDDRPQRLDEAHRDYEELGRLEKAVLRHAQGREKFEVDIPNLLRQSIDEVIDSPRSQRFLFSELEKTEKTYIGTKIEILLRNHLKLRRGTHLDVVIDGTEVDIKNTMGRNWMIPTEAVGHPCILIRADEKQAKCWFGIAILHQEMLRAGANKDGKSSISASNFEHVQWMLYGHDYPKNFWENIALPVRESLSRLTSGNARVAGLFRLLQRIPIDRTVILSLAPQKDPMKRLRKNGGARDQLAREGMALLSGKYDGSLIATLGLPYCGPTEFISIEPATVKERRLLAEAGHLIERVS